MKKGLALGVATLVAAALFWAIFPTTLGAAHYVYEPLSAEAFSAVGRSAVEFSASLSGSGVELKAGDAASQSFKFECKGVPVLLVINGPNVLSLLSFSGSEERSPAVKRFENLLKSKLGPLVPGNPVNAPYAPGPFETFVLKHRDGMDISAQCS